jgi:hypothetical protein
MIGRTAEGPLVELARHELGPERPVENEDAPRKRFEVWGRHVMTFGAGRSKRTIIVHNLLYFG